MQGLQSNVHYKYNQQSNIIYFTNGSQIFLRDLFAYPADPNFDELGSLEITDAFIDEINQCTEKAKNIVKSRIRYKLDENNLIPKLLGTCNPSKGWIYQNYYKPSKENTLSKDKQFIQALVTDNPDISQHYRSNLLSLDEASKQRLLYGNWEYDNDLSILINYDKIIDCFTNTHVPHGEKKITADIARLGGDRIVQIVWSGFRAKVTAWSRETLDRTGIKLEMARNEHGIGKSDVLVDEDGVGGGIVDFKGYKGFVNGSRPIVPPNAKKDGKGNPIPENYTNLKSQCSFKMADRINKGEVYIDCDDIEIRQLIIQEMEQVKQYNMDKDGKKSVVPKDIVKQIINRSPDFWDAIMMREWFELSPKRIFAG